MDDPATVLRHRTAQPSTHMGQRLLVVDDSRTVCKVVELVFHGSPWEVESVSSSDDAMRSIRMSRPDTILLDYRLPDGPGTALLASLRADPNFSDLPVVMLAGKHFPFEPSSAMAAGADGIVNKPFKTDELLEAVSNAIANAANRIAGLATSNGGFDRAPSIPDSRFSEAAHVEPPAAPIAPAEAAAEIEDDFEAAPLIVEEEEEVAAPVAAPVAPTPPPAPPSFGRTAAMRAIDPSAPRPAGPGETTESSGFRRLRPAAPPAPAAGFRRLAPQEPPKPALAGRPPLAPPAPEPPAETHRSADLHMTAPAQAVNDGEIYQTATISRPGATQPAETAADAADRETSPVGTAPVAAFAPAPAEPVSATPAPTAPPAAAAAAAAGPVEIDPEVVRAAVKELLPGIVKEYLAVLLRQTGQKLEKYGIDKVDEFVGRDLPRIAEETIAKKIGGGNG